MKTILITRSTPKPEELSWLACAIDGEGWVGLYRRGRRYPLVEVGVTNSDQAFLLQVANLTGGTIRVANHRKEPRKKQMFRVSVTGHLRVLAILKEVIPYLIIKKEKAREIIDFIEGREWGYGSPQSIINRIAGLKRSWANPEIRASRIKAARHGIGADAECSICGSKYYAKGLCVHHYNTVGRKQLCVRS